MNTIPILYEDDEIYIINKPQNLAVQGGQGVAHSLDVEFSKQVGNKVYLVHRLDKDTGGLMMVAKTSMAASKWTKLISSKAVKKEYLALCAGSLSKKEGIINDTVVQHGESKTAITHYKVEKEWSEELHEDKEDVNSPIIDTVKLSLIRLKLETGRMHQIRVHLAKNNCPIAGDDQHGAFRVNKTLKKYLKIKRLQLCSVKLTVPNLVEKGKDSVFTLSENDIRDVLFLK